VLDRADIVRDAMLRQQPHNFRVADYPSGIVGLAARVHSSHLAFGKGSLRAVCSFFHSSAHFMRF
jgi:hypothetical protein